MKIPSIFLDNKKRNLILWLTDMIVAIASYFYLTNPLYIQSILEKIDFATLRPDMDPQVFTSPMFFEFMFTIISTLSVIVIAVIAFLHTIAFYKCYQRKRAAIAYVKIYSIMAAISLVMWLLYNVSAVHILILIPAAIYFFVFRVEKQPREEQTVDNVLTNNNV